MLGFVCDTLDIEVNILGEAWPLTTSRDDPAVEATQRAYETALGRRALLLRGGGTIPIGGMFQRELGLPMVTFGLASGGNFQAPNEYIHQAHIPLAIDLAIHCYYHLTETVAR